MWDVKSERKFKARGPTPLISTYQISKLSHPFSVRVSSNTRILHQDFRQFLRILWGLFASTARSAYQLCHACLEVFMETEVEKFFSGRQHRQVNYKIQHFGDQLHPHHQGDMKWHHRNDGDGVGFRNVGSCNSFETAVYHRRIFRVCQICPHACPYRSVQLSLDGFSLKLIQQTL